MLTEFTPTSSVAVPVTVKVVVETTLPVGPETGVFGGLSARPKVSNFLVAFVGSLVPLVEKARASTCKLWLPVTVNGRDQPVEAALGESSVVLIVLPDPQEVRSSCRYRFVARSRTSI